MEVLGKRAPEQRKKSSGMDMPDKYDRFMKKTGSTYDRLINKMSPYLNPVKRCPGSGGGTGIISLEIAPLVNKVWGCDLSPEMIKTAEIKRKKKNIDNAQFTVKDAYDLDYRRESFDVVIASNVLHIMETPEQALASIRHIMKPGGVLIAPTYCHGQSIKSRLISRVMSLSGFKAQHKWSVAAYQLFWNQQI